ncbi:MAG: hypothetical protein ACE5EY_07760 [Anaerolineae bacterium]
MARIRQPKGKKGSLKWIQLLVNQSPEILNSQIKNGLGLLSDEEISWVSPVVEDEYAEYRDQAFIDLLEINLGKTTLSDFWPLRGPQWDALGKSSEEKIFLVEAKAHIAELNSSGTQAKGKSREQIQRSLEETRKYLQATEVVDWASSFYQYTNRLAHLYLLRELNDLPAYLVFVYFVNDEEMAGPKSKEEWQGALKLLHTYLGVGRNKLSKYILEVFVNVDFAE